MHECDRPFGGCSFPSKVACPAWSISAEYCMTGRWLREYKSPQPAVCKRCYACKGYYGMPATQAAMERRYKALMGALADGPGGERWLAFVESMAARINREHRLTVELSKREMRTRKVNGRYFRWFDSGDLQSVSHLRLVCHVAERTPYVQHFMPTKETDVVFSYINGERGNIPKNLTVRLSAHFVDAMPNQQQENMAGYHPQIGLSTVHTSQPLPGAKLCEEDCRRCRVCWTSRRIVSYRAK